MSHCLKLLIKKEVITLLKKPQISLLSLLLIFFLVFIGCSNNEVPANVSSVIGQTVVIISDNTPIRENPSCDSKSLIELEQGNLVRVVSTKVVENEEWSYVETFCLDYPPQMGWVLSKDYTTDKNTIIPNQGFIESTNVYAEPSSDSAIVHEEPSSRVQITKRENGWAYCIFPAGAEEGWVKESDISYDFPYEFPGQSK